MATAVLPVTPSHDVLLARSTLCISTSTSASISTSTSTSTSITPPSPSQSSMLRTASKPTNLAGLAGGSDRSNGSGDSKATNLDPPNANTARQPDDDNNNNDNKSQPTMRSPATPTPASASAGVRPPGMVRSASADAVTKSASSSCPPHLPHPTSSITPDEHGQLVPVTGHQQQHHQHQYQQQHQHPPNNLGASLPASGSGKGHHAHLHPHAPHLPYSSPASTSSFAQAHQVQQPHNGSGTPSNGNHDMAATTAMMYAAYQQQQQHFQQQMAALAHHHHHFQPHHQHSHQHDPRKRAPSLPNPNNGYHPSTGHFYQHQPPLPPHLPHLQTQPPPMHPPYHHHTQQQSQHHPHHPYPQIPHYPHPSSHHRHQQQQQQHHHQTGHNSSAAHSGNASAAKGPGRARAPTAPSSSSSSPHPHPDYSNGQPPMLPPILPFATSSRPASPSSGSSSPTASGFSRSRTESQNSSARSSPTPQAHTPGPVSAPLRGRTASGSSTVSGRPYHSHSPSSSASSAALISSTHMPPLPRLRTDSGFSTDSNGRSASPAGSDRAPTPTQALTQAISQHSLSSNGRKTPTGPGSTTTSTAAGQSATSSREDGTTSSAHCIPRKASPLSQQSPHAHSSNASHRSITPTQSRPFTSSSLRNDSTDRINDDEDDASDDTASERHIAGHRTTHSNASSAMTSESSNVGHGHGHKPHSNSLFKNKLRKALSLSELNNHSSSSISDAGSKNVGRSSLTSNSSSSDTSHSTMEPRTPPNGSSPVLPRGYAHSSSSNLHHSTGPGQRSERPANSLPSNVGRRFGLLNSKMNSSTDNISISSTVSSASVMLRRMGNLGKMARRSSVKSLSNIFHRHSDKHADESLNGSHSRVNSDAVSEFGVPGSASRDRKAKGLAVNPSMARVTAEVDRRGQPSGGMTPAEALVRNHQIAEKEREKAARAAMEEQMQKSAVALANSKIGKVGGGPSSANAVTDSPRSKLLAKEKEKLKQQNAGKKSGPKKWGFGAFGKKDNGNSGTVSPETSRTPSPASSSAAPSPTFDSSVGSSSSPSTSQSSPAVDQGEVEHRENAAPQISDLRPSLDGIAFDSWRKTSTPTVRSRFHSDATAPGEDEDEDDEGQTIDDFLREDSSDDRTPRQSMEVLGDNSGSTGYSDWDGEPPNSSSFFDDDTASFNEDRTATTTATGKFFPEPEGYYEEEEDDDGGHDGRSGQQIPARPPPNARPAKGILKNSRGYSQEALIAPQPPFTRPRASSYDAPHQTSAPNQPGKTAALAQIIPSGDQVDGLDHHPPTAPRADNRPSSPEGREAMHYAQQHHHHHHHYADKENISPHHHCHTSTSSSFSGPYGNPSLNASAPILAQMDTIPLTKRAMTGPSPGMRRNISFAQNLSVHTTWPGSIYDRRGELATCNRLTPALAQTIKEELNAFKMEEMEVHYASRAHTHFFI